MQITDEMIEEARETYKAFVKACVTAGNASYSEHDAWGAALSAALPLIRGAVVEECAKEAEEWQVYFKHSGERASGEIAAAIRALTGDKP